MRKAQPGGIGDPMSELNIQRRPPLLKKNITYCPELVDHYTLI